MTSSNTSGQDATRLAPAIMLVLIVIFILQLILVESTWLRIAIGVVLIAALGGTIGWLLATLRRDDDGVTGI